jgi:hypothetical protein
MSKDVHLRVVAPRLARTVKTKSLTIIGSQRNW